MSRRLREVFWSALGSILIMFGMVSAFTALFGFFAYALRLAEWLPGEILGGGVVFMAVMAVIFLAEMKSSFPAQETLADPEAEKARRSAEKDVGIVDSLVEILDCERSVVVARARQFKRASEEKKSERTPERPPPLPGVSKEAPDAEIKRLKEAHKKELGEVRRSLRESEERNRGLTAENTALSADLKTAQNEARILGSFRDISTRLTEEKAAWVRERASYESRVDELTRGNSALSGELCNATAEFDRRIASLESTKSADAAEFETVRLEYEHRLSELAQQCEAFRRERDGLIADCGRLQERFCAELGELRRAHEAAADSWAAERRSLEERLETAASDLRQRDLDIQTANLALESKTSELSARALELGNLRSELAEKVSELSTARTAQSTAEARAAAAEAEAAESIAVITHFSELYPDLMEESLSAIVDEKPPEAQTASAE